MQYIFSEKYLLFYTLRYRIIAGKRDGGTMELKNRETSGFNPDETKTVSWTPSEDSYTAIRARYPRPVQLEVFNIPLEKFSFYPLLQLARATLRYEPEVYALLEKCASSGTVPDMAFVSGGNRVLIADTVPENLWFIGDVHGDLLALLAAVDYIDNYPAETAPVIVFLGDACDRVNWGYETLLTIFHYIITRPGRVLFLAGNHDIELFYNKRYDVFYPGVIPADFCEWLNLNIGKKPELSYFGQWLIGIMKRMPHVLFLPDGTFAAHGGVPHIDLQRTIHSVMDLDTINARQDFTWARFSPDEAHCDPNRRHKDIALGYRDFDAFCELAEEILEQPVLRMIHGHEHPVRQWYDYPRYREHPIVTINSHRMVIPGAELTDIAVARHRAGGAPEIHVLDLTVPASYVN